MEECTTQERVSAGAATRDRGARGRWARLGIGSWLRIGSWLGIGSWLAIAGLYPGAGFAAPVPQPANDSSASSVKVATPAPEALRGLRERWLGAMETLNVPGLAVAVVGPDGILYRETLGVRDVEENLPVDGDTMFYIVYALVSP